MGLLMPDKVNYYTSPVATGLIAGIDTGSKYGADAGL